MGLFRSNQKHTKYLWYQGTIKIQPNSSSSGSHRCYLDLQNDSKVRSLKSAVADEMGTKEELVDIFSDDEFVTHIQIGIRNIIQLKQLLRTFCGNGANILANN